MRACVIFDTRYGNTERIANAFEEGLAEMGIETARMKARDMTVTRLKEFDLICVGVPTEWPTPSKPTRSLLEKLNGIDLVGKLGFAFDTKLGRPLSGSAAKHIERQLKRRGLRMIAPSESAINCGMGSSLSCRPLREEERFREIGREVGTALLRDTDEKKVMSA